MFTPIKTSSPIDYTFQPRSKEGKLYFDFAVPVSFLECLLSPLGRPAAAWLLQKNDPVGRVSSTNAFCNSLPQHMVEKWFGQFEKLVPQKVTMAYRSEEKNIASLKEPMEPPPLGSGIPEANFLQEKQKDVLLRATEGLGAV